MGYTNDGAERRLDRLRERTVEEVERDARIRRELAERIERGRLEFLAKHGATVWRAMAHVHTSKFVESVLFDFQFNGALTDTQVAALERTCRRIEAGGAVRAPFRRTVVFA